MREKEKSYYETLKNNPKDYVSGKLFVVENGITKPIEGKWFKLMGDGIPFIYYTDLTREQNEAGVPEPPHPLELIMSFTSERTITATPALGDSIFTFEQEAGIDSKLGNWIKKNEEKEKIEKKEREERKNRLENGIKNIKNKQNDMPGINGIPVALTLDKYDALIVDGWERDIDFLIKNKYTNTHKRGLHCALDISSRFPSKVGVYATHKGTISINLGGTNPLYLQNNDIRTVYAHMHSYDILVKNGAEVEIGTLLGYMGNAGTRGNHLHYEIQYNITAIKELDNTGAYGVFSSGDVWKSINIFTYEGEILPNGETLGRAIPNASYYLTLKDYLFYFKRANDIIALQYAPNYTILGALYTVPRSENLLKWLKNNGL